MFKCKIRWAAQDRLAEFLDRQKLLSCCDQIKFNNTDRSANQKPNRVKNLLQIPQNHTRLNDKAIK